MLKIESLTAREILDARGEPTLRVNARLSDGSTGTAAVPSGDPEEERETVEVRDGDVRRYGGRGVRKAVKNVNALIAPALESGSPETVREIDHILQRLDGTPNKSRLGANAVFGVSLACARALAAHYRMPLYRFLGGENACRLPVPVMALPLNGSGCDLREIGVAPLGAENLREGLQWYWEILRGWPGEGGTMEETLRRAAEAIRQAGCAGKVKLAVNAAATAWAVDDHYRLPRLGAELTTEELMEYWISMAEKVPLFLLEDPLGKEDPDGWTELTLRLGNRVQLAGDALFAGSSDRLRQGISDGAGNGLVLHPHQMGTVSEILALGEVAKSHGWQVLPAPAPGETADDFPADLAVALGTGQLKLGVLRGMENLSKVDRLLAIEEG